MKRIRVIPALLLQDGGLVKSIRFKNHKYIGDPINAVKIFNDKEVDEIVIMDISATKESRGPDLPRIKEIASEAFMPLGYGGGITKLDEIIELITIGVEKVLINTAAFENLGLIEQAAKYIGSQSIVVSIDAKKNILGKYRVYICNGTKNTHQDPVEFARNAERAGAGELLINSIEFDGTFNGYDTKLIQEISSAVSIPLIAVGGAGTINDFVQAVSFGASAVAAGSMFVFQRPHRAVLISYPTQQELIQSFFQKIKQ
jgi:cyclase